MMTKVTDCWLNIVCYQKPVKDIWQSVSHSSPLGLGFIIYKLRALDSMISKDLLA